MRVCKLTLITFFVIVAAGRFAENAQEKKWLSYEPAVVELKGTLRIRSYYGPPNYGENPDTDTKELLPILILDEPVNVRGNSNPNARFDRRSVEDLKEIQLVLRMPHKEFIDKTVLVKGTLFQALTGHHHTDVLMDVRSIKLDPEVKSLGSDQEEIAVDGEKLKAFIAAFEEFSNDDSIPERNEGWRITPFFSLRARVASTCLSTQTGSRPSVG